MIPTMILLGLVLGRWWRLALASAALVWPVLLVATNVIVASDVVALAVAAALAAGNAGAGVLVHQTVLLVRRRGHPHGYAAAR